MEIIMNTDFSIHLLDSIDFNLFSNDILSESELMILTESPIKFFRNMKNASINRLKSKVNAKYDQFNKHMMQAEKILESNKAVDVSRMKRNMENAASKHKNSLSSTFKQNTSKIDTNTIKRVSKDISEMLSTSKRTWFNFKYWDPDVYLKPLLTVILVYSIRLILLGMFGLPGIGSDDVIVYRILFLFVAYPMVEEIAKATSIQSGSGGTHVVAHYILDSIVMGIIAFMFGNISILTFILLRLMSAGVYMTNFFLQVSGSKTGEDRSTLSTSAMFNIIRTTVEYVVIFSKDIF
jgi:hypothetical protein